MSQAKHINPGRRAAMMLVIGGLELSGNWRKHSPGSNGLWRLAVLAHDRFHTMGLMMAGCFILASAVSFGMRRLRCESWSPQF